MMSVRSERPYVYFSVRFISLNVDGKSIVDPDEPRSRPKQISKHCTRYIRLRAACNIPYTIYCRPQCPVCMCVCIYIFICLLQITALNRRRLKCAAASLPSNASRITRRSQRRSLGFGISFFPPFFFFLIYKGNDARVRQRHNNDNNNNHNWSCSHFPSCPPLTLYDNAGRQF